MRTICAFPQAVMSDHAIYSPAEVAQALGVSVTTIKRWVDAGVLPAHKTAGGHRKILRADVLRLARQGHFPRLDLGRLQQTTMAEFAAAEQLVAPLFAALRAGDTGSARRLIHGAYAAGMRVEEIGDSVIAPAMQQLGHDWERGRIDVLHEHRATLICTGLLHELKPVLEANAQPDRPIAAGGNPEGDHSLLASLLVQLVLLDAGWDAINLGPNTPLASFRRALHELHPRLLWLSVSYLPEPELFLEQYRGLAADAAATGTALAVGGHGLTEAMLARMPYQYHGPGLLDLAAFAATLSPLPRPPKRGRPVKRPP